jgi:hypothetical protein
VIIVLAGIVATTCNGSRHVVTLPRSACINCSRRRLDLDPTATVRLSIIGGVGPGCTSAEITGCHPSACATSRRKRWDLELDLCRRVRDLAHEHRRAVHRSLRLGLGVDARGHLRYGRPT